MRYLARRLPNRTQRRRNTIALRAVRKTTARVMVVWGIADSLAVAYGLSLWEMMAERLAHMGTPLGALPLARLRGSTLSCWVLHLSPSATLPDACVQPFVLVFSSSMGCASLLGRPQARIVPALLRTCQAARGPSYSKMRLPLVWLYAVYLCSAQSPPITYRQPGPCIVGLRKEIGRHGCNTNVRRDTR